ncbi:MAG TPA: two-component regulator propeller domain-containing protein [Verrucomicrobiae bacterium]
MFLSLSLRRTRLWGFGLLFALLALAGHAPILRAQRVVDSNPDFLVDNWLALDGIPESSALSLAQTPDGYIWVGSDDGLLRFNGVDFTQIAPMTKVEWLSSEIVCLATDPAGRLWVGAGTRVAFLDQAGWHGVSGTNGQARSFAEDATGTVYCGTFEGRVCVIKDSQFQPIDQPQGMFGSGVFCIRDAKDGGLWLANRGFIGRRAAQQWKRFNQPALERLSLLAAPARQGGIWVLSAGTLRHFNADGAITSNAVPDVSDFRQLMEAPSGDLWVASTSQGVTRLIPHGDWWEARTLTDTNGLAQNSIWSLLADTEGNYWVGSSSGGLHRLSTRQFDNVGQADGLPDNVVRSVIEISPGHILAGTHGGGLAEISGGKVISKRPAAPGPQGRYGWSLLKDSAGRLWIGTFRGGLFMVENGVEKLVPMPPELRLSVNCLMQDSRGRIWVGTESGLGYIENGAVRTIPTNASAVIDNANCMADDPRTGAVWIGTSDHGLFRVADENFSQIDRVEGLASDRITCVNIDSDGCAWVGVFENGLACVRNKTVTPFGAQQGLPARIVASIVDDGRGYYWMGTDRGIVRVSKGDLHKVREGAASSAAFTLFDNHDGVGWGNCADGNQPSALQDADGKLWFATLNGVVVADPSKLRLNTNPPPVFVERVAFTDASGQRQELTPPFNNSISLPAGSVELEFHFAALSFDSPDKVRMYYILAGPGADANWQDIGGRRELDFHSPLAPGSYQLRLKAHNRDGVWNQTGASLAFAVEPFFWQSYWFRIGGLAAMTGLAGLAAWRVTRRRYRRRIALLEKERALEQEKARLAAVMEGTSDLVAFAGSDGRLIHVNPAGRKLLGYGARENVNSLNLASIFPPWAARRFNEEAVPAARRDGTWEGESALLASDGREIPVSQVIIAHKNAGGEINFLSTVARDITERKQAEKEKERLLEELLQSRKMESVGRLAGGIAHDFNNMMQVVLGNASLALEICPPEGALHAHLKEIEGSANRSADLTRRLLAFARKQKVQPRSLDLNETVAGMLKVLGRLIGENIRLNWLPGKDLWPVTMDPLQIDQILANLAVNARDAIASHGIVSIQTANAIVDETATPFHADRVAGEFVVLSVSDTGKGMTPEVLEHIFEPFFTTKDIGAGTGLGLATVFGIVKQNQGWIEVDTEPERGSAFKVYLPRAQSSPEARAESRDPQGPLPGGSETLLVVEDESAILELSVKVLQQCGYTVLSADSPEKALRLAAVEPEQIHLLLTDVIMPGMSGKDLRDKLQAARPGLKCLFMSGHDKDIFGPSGARPAGLHFLQKPFSHRQLACAVRALLDSV